MKNCAKCSAIIPATIVIDGKRRNLSCRKYCFGCSPFGAHNTRPVVDRPAIVVCARCGRRYEYEKRKGHNRTLCNSCVVNRRRGDVKTKAVAHMGGRCIVCGYDRCHRSLVFHHLEPTGKDFQLGGNEARSWESIQVELGKCVLLCANCHGEVHAGMVDLRDFRSSSNGKARA